MSDDVMLDEMRRIVREENLRLLRVLLCVENVKEHHPIATPSAAYVALFRGAPGAEGMVGQMQQAVIDYREGR